MLATLAWTVCLGTVMFAGQSECGPICRSIADQVKRQAWVEAPQTAALPAAQEAQWRRVQALAAGTMIVVTIEGSQAGKRRFVSADESTLAVERGEPAQTTETIARTDVIEVRAPKARSSGRKVGWGIAGYFLGSMAGGMVGFAVSDDQGGLIGALPGAAVGVFLGVRGGFRRPYEVVFSR
jgi:hypothetical protein